MRRSPRLLLLALVACNGEPTRTLPATTLVVSGEWLFTETAGNAALDVTCFSGGLVTVTQNGPRFTGNGLQSGQCDGPGGSDSFTDTPFTITDGNIDGTVVRFSIDECPHVGTAHGSRPDSVTGTVSCRIAAPGGPIAIQGEWRVVPPPDLTPPTLTAITFGTGANDTFEKGDDTLYVAFRAEDNKALAMMGYQLRDPSRSQIVREDSVAISGTLAQDTLAFPLPLSLNLPVPDGTPFQGSAFVRDSAGNVTGVTLTPILVRNPDPPSVTGTLAGVTRDSVGALRDTLTITVTASSPRPLTYVGYRLTNFVSLGDSIVTTATTASHTFRVPIPFEWKTLLLTVEVFVRDRLQLEDRESLGSARVVVFPSRPTQSFRMGQGVSDVVYDATRNRVYFMTAVDSGTGAGQPEVRVLQLDPARFLPGIPLPWFADGIDLSPGDDSLLATLYDARLGIIDLNTLAMDSTEPIAFSPSHGRYPYKVRAMANNKAMVSIASAYWGSGAPGQLIEFDLASEAQRLRTDVGAAGDIGLTPMLARTSDRQRLLIVSSGAAAVEAQLYHAATDQFSSSVFIGEPVPGRGVSGSRTGSLWLVGNRLLGTDLTLLRVLGTGGPQAVASALTDDGTIAYVAVPEGVAKFRTSDGVVLERILLFDPPYQMLVTPDGNTLIAIGPGLQVVDLR